MNDETKYNQTPHQHLNSVKLCDVAEDTVIFGFEASYLLQNKDLNWHERRRYSR